ncbi:hypothetical protein L1887_33248 [Cichorium endivia]|nr:hypothetical protein L1887_33248 [Cichorium endivia]
MRSFFRLSSCPFTGTDVRSSTSLPPPHNHHPTVKQPIDPTRKPPNSRHMDGSDGGGTSSFIKIQGIDNQDIGIANIQSSEVKASVTNLVATDYIRRFHERNKHESVLLVLPPPPPPPPRQGRLLGK